MHGPILGITTLLLVWLSQSQQSPTGSRQANMPSLLNIEWVGDPHCQPNTDVIEGLRRLLGAIPDSLLDAKLVVHAELRSELGGYSLMLNASGPLGPLERQIAAPSCSEIAQAAALVLSLWIQPALSPNLDESTA